jgi:hypothetical protein
MWVLFQDHVHLRNHPVTMIEINRLCPNARRKKNAEEDPHIAHHAKIPSEEMIRKSHDLPLKLKHLQLLPEDQGNVLFEAMTHLAEDAQLFVTAISARS